MKILITRMLSLAFFAFLTLSSSEAQLRKESNALKKKEKVERSYKKAYAKARKRTIKHRREIQSEATRKRMDEADKRANTYNRQNDPGFAERYFKKKRPPKK
jgi:peptidoglycan hydrolase CwlO-like protein